MKDDPQAHFLFCEAETHQSPRDDCKLAESIATLFQRSLLCECLEFHEQSLHSISSCLENELYPFAFFGFKIESWLAFGQAPFVGKFEI